MRMTTIAARGLAATLLSLAAGAAFAQSTPAGLWKTIDDETRKPTGMVRIIDKGGEFIARIEKILTDQPDAVCDKCEGDLKDKPVLGMQILSGLKAGDDWYEGGRILDPKNGKVYRAKMRLLEGGSKLEVRGFIGVSLMGRSQIWHREQ